MRPLPSDFVGRPLHTHTGTNFADDRLKEASGTCLYMGMSMEGDSQEWDCACMPPADAQLYSWRAARVCPLPSVPVAELNPCRVWQVPNRQHLLGWQKVKEGWVFHEADLCQVADTWQYFVDGFNTAIGGKDLIASQLCLGSTATSSPGESQSSLQPSNTWQQGGSQGARDAQVARPHTALVLQAAMAARLASCSASIGLALLYKESTTVSSTSLPPLSAVPCAQRTRHALPTPTAVWRADATSCPF